MKNYDTYDDNTLVSLLIQNDEKAFIEIYKRYWDKLYSVACNKLYEYYIAQEIVQNIFISMWERRNSLELHTSLNIYLAAALKYQIINARQKKSREKLYIQFIQNNATSQGQNTTENTLSFKELQDRLAKVVTKL